MLTTGKRLIIAIANPKGGVGKSATAINLAYHIKASLIIDQDNNASISEANRLSSTPKNVIRANDIETIVKALKSHDGHVVIDTGGYNSKLAQQVLSIAHVVVTPSGQSVVDLVGLKNLNQMLHNLSEPGNVKTALVFPSKFNANKRNFNRLEASVSKLEHLTYLPVCVHLNSKIENAANTSKAVFEVFGYDKAARQYKAILEEVIKHAER